ncbi:MAG: methyltransferase domain-containing protein [Ignavibacteriaceae bacterium]|nr:methyltransferase domain-containing protein [Ignavibacteriaceae bacterium]
MKLHNNLLVTSEKCIDEIMNGGRLASLVIKDAFLANKKLGGRDRRFVAETVYDVVRNFRLLANISFRRDYTKGDPVREMIMNYLYLFKAEDFPQLKDEAEKITALKAAYDNYKGIRKIRESVPDWLDLKGEEELGERWEKELSRLNEQAQLIIRVNTLKTGRESLIAELKKEDIPASALEGYPEACTVDQRKNLYASQAFRNGLFEVQDASSQLVAPFLKPEKNLRVIDACAGAGGKSLHLAALMKNSGKIISMDVDEWKLKELQRRAKRNGISNIETRLIDSGKTIKRLENSADRLLLDVPCSGSGVLRRNPDAKWRLTPEELERLKQLQQDILDRYTRVLKSGGLLVYATCSIFPSENEKQVEKLLAAHEEFRLEDQVNISPYESGFDGFFIARMRKL